MTLNITQQITIKGILRDDNRILFVKDKKNHWELPGGRVMSGE